MFCWLGKYFNEVRAQEFIDGNGSKTDYIRRMITLLFLVVVVIVVVVVVAVVAEAVVAEAVIVIVIIMHF